MTYECQQTLLSEEDLVKRAAATVPGMLAHPAITLNQVLRLRTHIDECIARLGHLTAEMELVGADQDSIEAAEAIQRVWRSLALDVADRERSFETTFFDVQDVSADGTD